MNQAAHMSFGQSLIRARLFRNLVKYKYFRLVARPVICRGLLSRSSSLWSAWSKFNSNLVNFKLKSARFVTKSSSSFNFLGSTPIFFIEVDSTQLNSFIALILTNIRIVGLT